MSKKYLFLLSLAGMIATGSNALAQAETQTTVTTTTTTTNDSGMYPRGLIFAEGGGWNDLRNVDQSGLTDFNTGYNFGGGLGLQLNDYVALRAVYNFGRSEAAGGLAPLSGAHFDHHYYGADLQFRAHTASGFAPYVFVGGGGVTVDPTSSVLFAPNGARVAGNSFTTGAGRFGVGFEYQIPNSGFGLFAQADGWLYKWNHYGFNRTQLDSNWGGGISYRFGS